MSGPDLERFVDDFIDHRKATMGVDFIKEPFAEDVDLTELYLSLMSGTTMEVGIAFKLVLDRYWAKQAMAQEQKATWPEVKP